MTYKRNYLRVIPRDLFNEANLMKCYGRLWILLDDNRGHRAELGPGAITQFIIGQDDSSGAISVINLHFTVDTIRYTLERPINSRESWPLIVTGKEGDEDFEGVDVFTESGEFTEDMRRLIGLKPL